LIFDARDRILKGLPLALEPSVSSDFGYQRAIADLTERLIHAVMPHVVSVQKPKDIGGDGRRRDVNVMNGGGMDLTVVCGAFE
jgi:hypothetical protein